MDKILKLSGGLMTNIFVLLAVIYLYLSIEAKLVKNKKLQTLSLSIFSAFSYGLILLSSFEVQNGVFLDVRTVFAGISGLYFGLIPGVIGALFGVIFRILMGGDGVIGGSLEIILSFLVGIVINKLEYFRKRKNKSLFLYLYSLLMYFISLSVVFTVPNSLEILKLIFIPYVFVFPLTTVLISSSLAKRIDFLELDKKLRFKERLIHASINSTSLEQIFAVDKNYNYLYFNESHYLETKKLTGLSIKENTSLLSYFKVNDFNEMIKLRIDEGIKRNNYIEVFKSEIFKNNYIEARYRNVYIDNKFVGIAVSLLDVTERENNLKEIKRLSYIDQLTKLHNRRYYDENIAKYDDLENITVAYVDINGLKLINDSFGHHVGDKLIVMVSDVLNKYFGHDEKIMLARIGGDEFIIICEDCNFAEVNNRMKALDEELSKLHINNLSVLISYGISLKNKKEDSLDAAVKEAESIMYEKKLVEITMHRNHSIKQLLDNFREMYPEEGRHSNRVAEIATNIATALNIKSYELTLLRLIANYHDIGKISLPKEIINKFNLTHTEEVLLKTHPEIGYRIMSSSPEYTVIANDILSHHENFDGTGYPRRLKGQQIPLKSRIISVAEMLDCLIYDRYGEGAITFDEAIERIKSLSGKRFDPKVVETLLKLVEKGQIRKYSAL